MRIYKFKFTACFNFFNNYHQSLTLPTMILYYRLDLLLIVNLIEFIVCKIIKRDSFGI